jgi:hypothetical protein
LSTSIFAAGICPVSLPVSLQGIGDGCTIDYNGIPYAPPEVYAFRSVFTPACVRHDACYTSLGGTPSFCDSRFLNETRAACRTRFSPWFPIELAACLGTAQTYHTAIVAARQPGGPTNFPSLQRDAFARFQQLNLVLNSGSAESKCSTTAQEQTNLFSQELIAEINTVFANNVGRSPTVFEYFGAANSSASDNVTPLIFSDFADWQNRATNYAISRQVFPVVTNVSYVANEGSFAVTNPTPGATYVWVLNANIAYASGINIALPQPSKYDSYFPIKGYLYGSNANRQNENIVSIDRSVRIPGWCAPRPGPGINCY